MERKQLRLATAKVSAVLKVASYTAAIVRINRFPREHVYPGDRSLSREVQIKRPLIRDFAATGCFTLFVVFRWQR